MEKSIHELKAKYVYLCVCVCVRERKLTALKLL